MFGEFRFILNTKTNYRQTNNTRGKLVEGDNQRTENMVKKTTFCQDTAVIWYLLKTNNESKI